MRATNTFYYSSDILVQTGRAWSNLNLIAKKLVELGALSEHKTVSISRLARMLDMDNSHVTRLISNKVGFVKTVSQTATGSYIGSGIYYHAEVRALAKDGEFYPRAEGLATLVHRLGAVGLPRIKVIPYTGERAAPKPEKTKPVVDTYLTDLIHKAGKMPDGEFGVPYLDIPPTISTTDLESLLGNAVGPLPDLMISALPVGDIESLSADVAKHLVNFASAYHMLNDLKKMSEVV